MAMITKDTLDGLAIQYSDSPPFPEIPQGVVDAFRPYAGRLVSLSITSLVVRRAAPEWEKAHGETLLIQAPATHLSGEARAGAKSAVMEIFSQAATALETACPSAKTRPWDPELNQDYMLATLSYTPHL